MTEPGKGDKKQPSKAATAKQHKPVVKHEGNEDRQVHKDKPSKGENQSDIKKAYPEDGGEDTDNTKHAAVSSSPAGERSNTSGEDDPALRDESLNDDPMGREAREEVADRQADSDADSATTFARTYLAQGEVDDDFDHGPNKQCLISEAINNGLRLIGKGDEPIDDEETSESAEHIAVEDLDDFVQLVSSEEIDFGIPGKPMISTALTYQGEVVPAHLVGSGPTEALSDQAGTMADVLSPRHVGSTGSPV